MHFSKKLTYPRALVLPFLITPVESLLQLLSNIISLGIAPLGVLVTAYFIDTALAVVSGGGSPYRIILPLVIIGGFSVYGYMSWPLIEILNKRREIKTRLALRSPLIEKRAKLEYKHVENSDTLDLLKRVWDNPERQLSGIFDNLLQFVLLLGTVVSYAVILLINAPISGVILIVFTIPVLYIASKGGRERYNARRHTTTAQRMSQTISWFLVARDTAAERNMFGYSEYLGKKFEHYYEQFRTYCVRINAKWFAKARASSILLGLLSAIGLFIMAPAVADGSLTVGLFIALQVALFGIIGRIGGAMPRHFESFALQVEFLKDLNRFTELSEVPDAEVLPDDSFEFESLEFKNVTFSYPGTQKLVLNGLTLKMEKGKHYAFVGENGAGKTTLIKLITRLYNNYTGLILLNGRPLQDWPMSRVKACFCAVFQDFARYDITVSENVCIGKINGATPDEVDNALSLAGFNAELPDGKDTLLGKTHDANIDLSGGQWQRLAFARAIASPAPVKILDEPTAALDPVAESQVYAQFEKISRGFTTIYISHRLASAKLADTIFVLNEGKVAEYGNHDTLMERGGMYAEMFTSQQSWYE